MWVRLCFCSPTSYRLTLCKPLHPLGFCFLMGRPLCPYGDLLRLGVPPWLDVCRPPLTVLCSPELCALPGTRLLANWAKNESLPHGDKDTLSSAFTEWLCKANGELHIKNYSLTLKIMLLPLPTATTAYSFKKVKQLLCMKDKTPRTFSHECVQWFIHSLFMKRLLCGPLMYFRLHYYLLV